VLIDLSYHKSTKYKYGVNNSVILDQIINKKKIKNERKKERMKEKKEEKKKTEENQINK